MSQYYWNISRMECKADIALYIVLSPVHWNISRMECKGKCSHCTEKLFLIGIYPEWNVKELVLTSIKSLSHWNISRMECKAIFIFLKSSGTSIGIYPEWNVKIISHHLLDGVTELEYIQNGM